MEKFFVSTDSTCDLYASEIASLKVGFVPLTYTVGSGENTQFVKDNFTEPQQYVDFFNLLRRGLPVKTAMLNFNDHYVYFLSLAEKGINNILHFTISYGLARTMEVGYEAVAEVKEKYPDFNVLIVESHTTTVGQGILVREACRMRDEGKTLEDTAEYV
ncbi:MAG: DegV family protein, partial [Clostridia bacterium]